MWGLIMGRNMWGLIMGVQQDKRKEEISACVLMHETCVCELY